MKTYPVVLYPRGNYSGGGHFTEWPASRIGSSEQELDRAVWQQALEAAHVHRLVALSDRGWMAGLTNEQHRAVKWECIYCGRSGGTEGRQCSAPDGGTHFYEPVKPAWLKETTR